MAPRTTTCRTPTPSLQPPPPPHPPSPPPSINSSPVQRCSRWTLPPSACSPPPPCWPPTAAARRWMLPPMGELAGGSHVFYQHSRCWCELLRFVASALSANMSCSTAVSFHRPLTCMHACMHPVCLQVCPRGGVCHAWHERPAGVCPCPRRWRPPAGRPAAGRSHQSRRQVQRAHGAQRAQPAAGERACGEGTGGGCYDPTTFSWRVCALVFGLCLRASRAETSLPTLHPRTLNRYCRSSGWRWATHSWRLLTFPPWRCTAQVRAAAACFAWLACCSTRHGRASC